MRTASRRISMMVLQCEVGCALKGVGWVMVAGGSVEV